MVEAVLVVVTVLGDEVDDDEDDVLLEMLRNDVETCGPMGRFIGGTWPRGRLVEGVDPSGRLAEEA